MEELAGRRIERERNLVASLVAGLRDRVDDELQRLLVGGEAGRETSLVPHSGGQLLLLEHALERVIDLGHRAQGLRVRRGADRAHHELLQVDRGVGVRAAVEDVGEGQGQQVRLRAAQVAVERHAGGLGGRVRHGERDAQQGVGAEPRLVWSSV